MAGMNLPTLRPALIAVLALACLGSACTVPPMQRADELRVDSITLAPQHSGGVSSPPFCLHLRFKGQFYVCLLYTSPSPRDKRQSRMPSSA